MQTIPKEIYKKLLLRGVAPATALSVFLLIPNEGGNKQGNIHVTYRDPVGIPTACWGQTGKDIKDGMTFTDDQCVALLAKHISENSDQIDKLVKVEFQNPYQKAAFIDFIYNAGSGNLAKSSLLKLFNEGQYKAACSKLSDWVYAQGKKLGGLVRRRGEEYAYCIGKPPKEVQEEFENTQVE